MFVTEMNGAATRIRRERSLAWHSAMIARVEKPPTHDEFVHGVRAASTPAPDWRSNLAAWEAYAARKH